MVVQESTWQIVGYRLEALWTDQSYQEEKLDRVSWAQRGSTCKTLGSTFQTKTTLYRRVKAIKDKEVPEKDASALFLSKLRIGWVSFGVLEVLGKQEVLTEADKVVVVVLHGFVVDLQGKDKMIVPVLGFD